jgi:succinate--hydroxymethylglutarate CoA-transferase
VGVAVTDIATGLYAHGAVMAAILSRQKTGKGVWIDCNLFESQVSATLACYTKAFRLLPRFQIAGLANIASNYLIAGQEASRHGTTHPSIVPYQMFPCKDGWIMIGAGNDKQVNDSETSFKLYINGYIQFKALAEKILKAPELAKDAKFSSNDARVANRVELVQIISNVLSNHNRDHWLEQLTGLGYARVSD